MPTHGHLMAVPTAEAGFRRAVGETHRRDTRPVNVRGGWRGHLWLGRFASSPLEETSLGAAPCLDRSGERQGSLGMGATRDEYGVPGIPSSHD